MALLMLLSRYNMIRKRQDMVVFTSTPSPPWSHYFNSNDFILAKDGMRRAFHNLNGINLDGLCIQSHLSRHHKVDFTLREYVSFLFYFFPSFFLLNFCLAHSSFPRFSIFPLLAFVNTGVSGVERGAVAIKEDSVQCKAWGRTQAPQGGANSCCGHRTSITRCSDL